MHAPNNRTHIAVEEIIFHSFATEEVPLSWWLVMMAMLVVDGKGNDTNGLWLASDFHRFKEREVGWSITK